MVSFWGKCFIQFLVCNIHPNSCLVTHFIWCEYSVCSQFYNELYFSTSMGIVSFLSFQIIGLITLVIIHIFTHGIIVTAIFGILVITIGDIMLNQIEDYVSRMPLETVDRRWLRFYFRQANRSVHFLADINAVYGRALYATLLVGVPANAVLIQVLAIYQLDLPIRLILTLAGSFAVIFIFGVHLKAAVVIKKIHQPAKRLIKLDIFWGADHRRSKLKIKLKLQRYIEQFHTVKKFTVTYGSYGSITVQSFR